MSCKQALAGMMLTLAGWPMHTAAFFFIPSSAMTSHLQSSSRAALGALSASRTPLARPAIAGLAERKTIRRRATHVATVQMESSFSGDGGAKLVGDLRLSQVYVAAFVLSGLSWIGMSFLALSFHPNPIINAACGLRHNALTIAQALAFPLPVGWAVGKTLRSAAAAGWDRLSSATYRRLNLATAAASLWLASASAFGPAFSVGYSLLPSSVAILSASLHYATALLALFVWQRSLRGVTQAADLKQGGQMMEAAGLVSRVVRGLVLSLLSLPPRARTDDPDQEPAATASLYAFSAAGLAAFAFLPVLLPFPAATIPSILGKRWARPACAFTWLAAVACYCLKDAAERGRLAASTFATLRKGLAFASAGHLLLVLAKVAGVDGGGVLLSGSGLWEMYPSMVAAPKAAAAMCVVYALLALVTWARPPQPEAKAK